MSTPDRTDAQEHHSSTSSPTAAQLRAAAATRELDSIMRDLPSPEDCNSGSDTYNELGANQLWSATSLAALSTSVEPVKTAWSNFHQTENAQFEFWSGAPLVALPASAESLNAPLLHADEPRNESGLDDDKSPCFRCSRCHLRGFGVLDSRDNTSEKESPMEHHCFSFSSDGRSSESELSDDANNPHFQNFDIATLGRPDSTPDQYRRLPSATSSASVDLLQLSGPFAPGEYETAVERLLDQVPMVLERGQCSSGKATVVASRRPRTSRVPANLARPVNAQMSTEGLTAQLPKPDDDTSRASKKRDCDQMASPGAESLILVPNYSTHTTIKRMRHSPDEEGDLGLVSLSTRSHTGKTPQNPVIAGLKIQRSPEKGQPPTLPLAPSAAHVKPQRRPGPKLQVVARPQPAQASRVIETMQKVPERPVYRKSIQADQIRPNLKPATRNSAESDNSVKLTWDDILGSDDEDEDDDDKTDGGNVPADVCFHFDTPGSGKCGSPPSSQSLLSGLKRSNQKPPQIQRVTRPVDIFRHDERFQTIKSAFERNWLYSAREKIIKLSRDIEKLMVLVRQQVAAKQWSSAITIIDVARKHRVELEALNDVYQRKLEGPKTRHQLSVSLKQDRNKHHLIPVYVGPKEFEDAVWKNRWPAQETEKLKNKQLPIHACTLWENNKRPRQLGLQSELSEALLSGWPQFRLDQPLLVKQRRAVRIKENIWDLTRREPLEKYMRLWRWDQVEEDAIRYPTRTAGFEGSISAYAAAGVNDAPRPLPVSYTKKYTKKRHEAERAFRMGLLEAEDPMPEKKFLQHLPNERTLQDVEKMTLRTKLSDRVCAHKWFNLRPDQVYDEELAWLLICGAPTESRPIIPDFDTFMPDGSHLLNHWDEPDSRSIQEKREEAYKMLTGEIPELVPHGNDILHQQTHKRLYPDDEQGRKCEWLGTASYLE